MTARKWRGWGWNPNFPASLTTTVVWSASYPPGAEGWGHCGGPNTHGDMASSAVRAPPLPTQVPSCPLNPTRGPHCVCRLPGATPDSLGSLSFSPRLEGRLKFTIPYRYPSPRKTFPPAQSPSSPWFRPWRVVNPSAPNPGPASQGGGGERFRSGCQGLDARAQASPWP